MQAFAVENSKDSCGVTPKRRLVGILWAPGGGRGALAASPSRRLAVTPAPIAYGNYARLPHDPLWRRSARFGAHDVCTARVGDCMQIALIWTMPLAGRTR